MAVVLWNRGNTTQAILGRFVNMQFDGKALVRDCLAHRNLGMATGQISYNVSAHDVRVFVLTPVNDNGEVVSVEDEEWRAQWYGHGIKVPQSRAEWEARKQHQ